MENRTKVTLEPTTSKTHLNTNKTYNIVVEANLGAGKTTLLEHLSQFKGVVTIKEPLDQWSNFRGTNLLNLMYSDPKQWAFPFQLYAMKTIIETQRTKTTQKFKIMERSLFGSKIFLEANKIYENIDPIKYEILNEWYTFIEREMPIEIDSFIYLRTNPKTIIDRITTRGRPEEKNIDPNYLQIIHKLHEKQFIGNIDALPAPVYVLNGNESQERIMEELKMLPIFGDLN